MLGACRVGFPLTEPYVRFSLIRLFHKSPQAATKHKSCVQFVVSVSDIFQGIGYIVPNLTLALDSFDSAICTPS